MRRSPILSRTPLLAVLIALVVSSCSVGGAGGGAEPTTSEGPTTSRPPSTTSSTTTSTTLPPIEPEGDFEVTPCGEDVGDVLCESTELIRRHYVDDIDSEALAAAAVEAIQSANLAPGGGVATCPVPSEEFVVVCEEIDAASLDPGPARETAVAGMIERVLDTNSAYLDAETVDLIEEEQSGEIEGIGALVSSVEEGSDETCQIISDTCRLEIVSTIEGGPARAADLQSGDVFVAVDGESIVGWTVDEVTAAVRGPAGSEVDLTLRRDGTEFSVTIERAAVQVPVVQSEMVGDVAYLRLNLFTDNADEQVRSELEDLLATDPSALVFDLRNNPGGLLDTSVRVASEFISEGIVVQTQSPESTTSYDVEPGGLATDPSLPVYVVVNQGSASASEVVAGALADNGRALVVGESTFGKNTVQQRFPLSNGGAVKLTIARWFTPDGRDFGGDGITPDIQAELPETLTADEVVSEVVALGTADQAA